MPSNNSVPQELQQKSKSIDYSLGKAYIHFVHNDEWLYYASHLWSATPMAGTQFE